jgi:hypothetical protein
MARVSIYVPDEMKARMDEAGGLNWSAAAQRAFEIEINSQRWKMETDAIEKTAARLRASKAEEEEQLKTEGRTAGQEWARDDATFRALKAISELDWSVVPEDAYGYKLACLILDEKGPSYPAEAGELWDELRGGYPTDESEPDAAWLEGFIEGAIEVWNEVADRV